MDIENQDAIEQVQDEQTSTPDEDTTSVEQVEDSREQVEQPEEPQEDGYSTKLAKAAELAEKSAQRISQMATTYERQLQAGDERAAAKTEERIQQEQSRVKAILDDPDVEYDPRKGFSAVAEDLDAVGTKFQSYEQKMAAIEQELSEYRQAAAESQQRAYEAEWKSKNTDLADKFDSLRNQLIEKVDAYKEQGITQPQALSQLANVEWERIVSAARNETAPKAPTTPKPTSTQPVRGRSTSKPTGATYNRTAAISALLGGT